MLVYLVRHAIAEERDSINVDGDFSRRLTNRGIERMNRNVSALAALGIKFNAIWSSPLVRARQTAELLSPLLVHRRDIEIIDDLSPGGNHAALLDRAARKDEGDAIALVGHEPDIGAIGTRLLFGSPTYGMTFKKGGVACIETDDRDPPLSGVLHWMLTPKQMRAMPAR